MKQLSHTYIGKVEQTPVTQYDGWRIGFYWPQEQAPPLNTGLSPEEQYRKALSQAAKRGKARSGTVRPGTVKENGEHGG